MSAPPFASTHLPRSVRAASWWLLSPAVVWLGAFFFIPLSVVLAISFASRGTYGGLKWTVTLGNYAALLDPLYLRIYGQSLLLATATTLCCLVLGFPLAYYMGRLSARWQWVWLVLILIPFWTNFLVRTYAWMFILRTEGLLNTVLSGLGIVSGPIEVLYTEAAVLLGLVYGYLPFMVLPLYAVLARVDPTLVEAAWDLYASGWAVFRRVILPLAKPGVIAGCLLVFVPSLGAFITPDLLGGGKTMMVGNLIQHEYLVVRDWPFGSAISFVLMGLVLLVVLGYLKGERLKPEA
ncbi:MAG: ABC transporter permease [Nitrospirales bacterium]